MSTDSDFISLNKKRESCKHRLASFNTFLADLTGELSDVQVFELQERTIRLEQLLSEFNEIQNEIELLTDEGNLAKQFEERDIFENSCFKALATSKRITAKEVEICVESRSGRGSVCSGNEVNASENAMLNGVRLPAIEITKYDGNYDAWLEFRDTFESLIHKNSSLNDMQRFHYLRSSLTKGAAEVIKSVEFCAKNYGLAWDLLCTRFNNDRLLVQNHLKAIFDIESITKESSTKIRNLIDSCSKHLRSLEQLEEPINQWDTIVIYILSQKLDIATSKEWEKFKSHIKVKPTLENFKAFLRGRADLLETIEANITEKRVGKSVRGLHTQKNTENKNCPVCKGHHFIQYCEKFLNSNIPNRMEHVKKNKLCINCLHPGHFSKSCKYGNCKICKSKHNSLLHEDKRDTAQTQTAEKIDNETMSLTLCNKADDVLLSTAVVQVEDKFGKSFRVKALLDCGSQSSFVSSDLCDKLKIRKSKIDMVVAGIGTLSSKIEYQCNLKIKSLCSGYSTELNCLVLDQITGNLPNIKVEPTSLNIPSNIKLADPRFYKPSKIDILIGADLFWSLLSVGQINLGVNRPILQKTRLGWVLSGPVSTKQTRALTCNLSLYHNMDVEFQLTKFWEIEEIATNKIAMSLEEKACEESFVRNTRRASDGRFVVTIPLKGDIGQLGESKEMAIQRFFSLERKFVSNPSLKERYVEFMREYVALGHMTITKEINDNGSYYMPHHGVVKEDSATTKLRTVFDASAPTSTGVSFNDIQIVGPTIQDDLMSILLRFREHACVVTADITKMYRQVMVNPSQRKLQKIVWRDDPRKPLDTYTLNTVTYGTASASFLAIRCVFQLASECEQELPIISNIIKRDFYVDDVITGANTADEASVIVDGITKVLRRGCFELHKWHSNMPNIFKGPSTRDTKDTRDFGANEKTKTLGLAWSCHEDTLFYNISQYSSSTNVTKRTILSSISQIFDPLGLLSPVTIKAKILMQRIWQEKLSWDESLPSFLNSSWLKLRTELEMLNRLQIKRHVICKDPVRIDLHAFSDASESAYGACIYIKSTNSNGDSFVNLLCSKTKVAPLKVLTIPKLELCGALILARLAKKVRDSLTVKFDSCTFWTDSSIVLGWLRMAPSSLKIFVGNRVSEIQTLTDIQRWRHVPSSFNPADILSRGSDPSILVHSKTWWNGPDWLREEEDQWPELVFPLDNLPEMRKQHLSSHVSTVSEIWFPFTNYSSLIKSRNVMAYILRFVQGCKNDERKVGMLTISETRKAFEHLLILAQTQSFSDEIKALTDKKAVSNRSKLLCLNPFIDASGILRVGGRLDHSDFTYEKKHPAILAGSHHLTKLIFIQEHNRLLHAGPQQLLASIRERFWVISGRNLAKATVKRCITCFKQNPLSFTPLMGNLPKARLQAYAPFLVTGVDYAGPFQVKDRRGRGAKITKAWICLFICFSSKAMHLELVSDLSAQSFILMLKRFVSRRGKPSHAYSDNGTNFKGASNELKAICDFLSNERNEITKWATNEGINWHFIPPHSPHFGGLWEAGVKSVKHHLKRVLKNSILTYEEFYSLLTQIEGVLNSRPLCPISCHPNDLIPLSPAHFLIGRTLTSVPEISTATIPLNRLDRYQYLQRLKEHFWARWHKEFLSELQQRCKWRTSQENCPEGALVVIKDDNLPPQHWRLGRIIKLHLGKDDIARVATVRTSNGTITRAFSKICPLPLPERVERGAFQGGGHV